MLKGNLMTPVMKKQRTSKMNPLGRQEFLHFNKNNTFF